VQRDRTLQQAKIAGFSLGMQVDIQALGHTLGGGAISERDHQVATQAIKRNYGKLIAGAVAGKASKTVDNGDE